ncbi:glycosyltransferase family 2 protein [Dysgonomonas sp. 216]|uniref:glycosyltransferase family 2 protein n=1 Tax=Dysgonomonas sp. 216 TaxID=2302934 RepID=UPI0013D57438|nr:glycosyltransferase family 2 protein [Dysgonomonas sp. 216]
MAYYPKITIVTPNYNQADYLEQTIQSVLGQNYPNLEYIIIDGASTDGSVEIIKKYADKLTYWESVADKGMYHAIQKGFEKSTGEIMAWINSDDMYISKSLFSVAEIFSSFKNVNWLLGFPTFYDAQGRLVHCSHTMHRWSKFDVYTGNYRWIQQESVFWRRTLWDKIGASIDISLKYAGDFDLWNKFFKHDKLYVTTALLSGFRQRDGEQLSMSQSAAYEKEIQLILGKNEYSESEKRVIRNYEKVYKRSEFLAKFRIFNAAAYLAKFKLQNFEYPPLITFNRQTQMFEAT